MRTRWLLSVCVAVTTGYLSISLYSRIQAMDEPDQKVATVEFHDVPGRPPLAYDLMGEIELVGTPRTFHDVKTSIGAGSTAPALALLYDGVWKDFTGLQYKLSTDKRSITIKGWRDPKTGKFYPVKKITFTSKTMPKAFMPKVTNPKRPIA